ncbi:hypothetical protein BSZ19_35505 [Bradyrhizobium japonicum]|uniref:Uncharacterized protein n=1 Tax=Bradyrhizobium japonicum TaxID=375 RepID=A0A1Y2JFS0_BRAJP|nr:hypothetical protein BSZ19_35505 [Bradyrhizobium japonicum]
MPVYGLLCPDCGHRFPSLVLAGTRMPSKWVCSQCGGHSVGPDADRPPRSHPWEEPHRHGCLCCGPAFAQPQRPEIHEC